MSFVIQRVAVIGAGTMGGALAAHFANAGLAVTLLDIVPSTLNDEETRRQLSLDHPAVRNRNVNAGLAALKATLWVLTAGAFAALATAILLAAPTPFAALAFAGVCLCLVLLNHLLPHLAWRAFAWIPSSAAATLAQAVYWRRRPFRDMARGFTSWLISRQERAGRRVAEGVSLIDGQTASDEIAPRRGRPSRGTTH